MIRGGAVAVIRRHRLGGRGRRPEGAEAVERAQRRYGLDIGRLAGDARAGLRGVAGHVDHPPQHLDEAAGHRQIRPARVGADMEQADDALAAMFAGDQRRAVFQRRPALGREHRVGLGQHLPVHGDVLWHGKACERAIGGEGSQMLRLLPGEAAAEAAAATAQFHRHQIVIGLRQTGTGETYQHAALIDPSVQALADFRRQRADIRQHDHRQPLIEELRDHLLRRAAVAEPHVGKRRQCAGEIEGRCQKRLRGIAGRAGDDADGAPPPSFVEQLHRAGGSFARYFQPRDVVAQLDRQIERGFGFAILCAKGVARLADRRSLGVGGANHARGNAVGGAQHLHRHLRCGVFGGDQRLRRGRAALEHRQLAVADGLAESFDEFGAASGVDAIGQPRDFGVSRRFQETVDGAKRFDAVDRPGFWRDLTQRDAGGAGGHQRNVTRGLGQRNQRHAAAVVVGIGDQFVGGLDARVPACGGAPAVVEQDHQRRAAAAGAGLRIPDRAGSGENHQRRGGEAQQGQPPRRPRRGFFLWLDVEQQPCRRKLDPPRPRRHHAQQPPQHRQAQQAEQQQRLGKGEGETRDHALRPALTVEPRAVPLAAIIPHAGTAAVPRRSGWWCGSRTASRACWSRCGFHRGAGRRARHSRWPSSRRGRR